MEKLIKLLKLNNWVIRQIEVQNGVNRAHLYYMRCNFYYKSVIKGQRIKFKGRANLRIN